MPADGMDVDRSARTRAALAEVPIGAVVRHSWLRVVKIVGFSVAVTVVVMWAVQGSVDPIGPAIAFFCSFVGGSVSVMWLTRYRIALDEHTVAVDRANSDLRDRNASLADRVDDLAGFSRTVAHDLKGPLAGVLGWLDVAADAVVESDAALVHEALSQIRTSADHAVSVVDGLLAMVISQVDGVQVVPVDPLEALERALRGIAASGVTQPVHVDPGVAGVGDVMAHPTALEAVWANLLGNAFKYGGHPPEVAVRAERRGARAVFFVDDNGAGVAPGVDPFASTPSEGHHWSHGLGLPITRAFVSRFGGQMGYRARPDGGTTFWFELRPAVTS